MGGNGPTPELARSASRPSWRIIGHSSPCHWYVDGLFVAILTALAALQTIAYWRAGLSFSPDSGFYLLYAARLRHALDYAAGAAMYAPLFPATLPWR